MRITQSWDRRRHRGIDVRRCGTGAGGGFIRATARRRRRRRARSTLTRPIWSGGPIMGDGDHVHRECLWVASAIHPSREVRPRWVDVGCHERHRYNVIKIWGRPTSAIPTASSAPRAPEGPVPMATFDLVSGQSRARRALDVTGRAYRRAPPCGAASPRGSCVVSCRAQISPISWPPTPPPTSRANLTGSRRPTGRMSTSWTRSSSPT